MELQNIMKRLADSKTATQDGIKTASAPSAAAAPTADALRDALHTAMATTEKTAAAPPVAAPSSPEGDLLKMAEDLTNAEEQAMQKQASILGAAMCDGFMERFAQYEDAAGQVAPAKTASIASLAVPSDATLDTIKTAAQDPAFQKFASENPDLVKEAFDLGYQQTYGQLVKEAQDDFQQGYDDTMGQVHQVAADSYKTAALTINNVLREAQAA